MVVLLLLAMVLASGWYSEVDGGKLIDGLPRIANYVARTLPPLRLESAALELIGLEPGDVAGEAWLTLQNLSPQRQQLRWPEGWSARREFTAGTEASCASAGTGDLLLPWQLGSWLVCSGRSPVDQSS